VEQRLDPSRWSPPVLDDGMASIDAWQGPWSRRVDDLTVDTKRSEMLAAFDVPCRVQGGTAPWQGTSPGHPWNVVIGDKTTLGDPTSGPMTVACALDRRVGTIDLALSLSDFEVVTQ